MQAWKGKKRTGCCIGAPHVEPPPPLKALEAVGAGQELPGSPGTPLGSLGGGSQEPDPSGTPENSEPGFACDATE